MGKIDENKGVEDIKTEIDKVQETIDILKETIQNDKEDVENYKVALEQLEKDLFNLMNDAMEINEMNQSNNKKIDEINFEISKTEKLIKVDEQIDKKIMGFWSVFSLFLVVYIVVFLLSYGAMHIVDTFSITESAKFIRTASIISLFWASSFYLIKKILLKINRLILRKDINKIYALFTCLLLIFSVGILTSDDNKSEYKVKATKNKSTYSVVETVNSMEGEDMLEIMTPIFAIIPSTLIKIFLFDDEAIFIDESNRKD